MSKTDANRRKRDTTRVALAALRESGAVSATFHEDGTVASVNFGPLAVATAPVSPVVPTPMVQEILASPSWPKTDLDALDDLPSYEDKN